MRWAAAYWRSLATSPRSPSDDLRLSVADVNVFERLGCSCCGCCCGLYDSSGDEAGEEDDAVRVGGSGTAHAPDAAGARAAKNPPPPPVLLLLLIPVVFVAAVPCALLLPSEERLRVETDDEELRRLERLGRCCSCCACGDACAG